MFRSLTLAKAGDFVVCLLFNHTLTIASKVERTVYEINKYLIGNLTFPGVFAGYEIFTCDRFWSALFASVVRRKRKRWHISFIVIDVSTPLEYSI